MKTDTREKKICIVKAGETLPQIAEERGDFEKWIREGMGLAPRQIDVVEVFKGAELPPPERVAGVVITGSAAFVSDREDWSERTAAWIPSLLEAETPTLGICYGHQLIAHAMGGRVDRNPRGREIGSIEVTLGGDWRDDPLLGGFEEKLATHVSHLESVIELPDGARLLGSSAGDPHQAFALGPCAWGLQFHPEFDAPIVRGYIEGRRQILIEESLDPDALLAQTRDSDVGPRLLRRFAQIALGTSESPHP